MFTQVCARHDETRAFPIYICVLLCTKVRARIQCISRSLWLEAIRKLYSKRLAFNPGEIRCWRSAMECLELVLQAHSRCRLIRKMGNRFDRVHEGTRNLNFELRYYLILRNFVEMSVAQMCMCVYMCQIQLLFIGRTTITR